MLLPTAVDHLKVVLLEFLKPACKLAFWIFEISDGEPVGPYNKVLPQEVWSEVIGEDHEYEKFFLGYAILAFCLTQHTAPICHHSLASSAVQLRQYGSNACITGVRIQNE